MDRNDQAILILGVLILILLLVAYYFLLFNPLRQEYLARYDERTQKDAQREKLERTIAELENVRRNAPDIERQILEYSKRIPEQDEIPTLVVQIEEIAEGAGVTQLLIEPGDPEVPPGGGDFSRIPIRMSFEGTYEEMQDFVLRLRNLARLVTINGVIYEEVEEQGGRTEGGRTTLDESVEDLLRVEIQAETYVQPAASEATTPADGGATPVRGATTPAGGVTTPVGGATTPTPTGEGKAGAGKTGGGKAR